MTEKEKKNYNKYRWFLEQVIPPEGYKVEDYYGIQFMTIMRNDTYDIRLQYDYVKNPVNGTAMKVETIEEVIEWIEILDGFKKSKATAKKAKKYDESTAKDYTASEDIDF